MAGCGALTLKGAHRQDERPSGTAMALENFCELEKSSQHFWSISASFDTHNDYIVNTMNEISMKTPNVSECSVNAVLVPENFPKKGK